MRNLSSGGERNVSNSHNNENNNTNSTTSTTTTINNEPKWTSKEKLYLISSVMVNGDSNWDYVCDCLNRFVAQTTPNATSRSLHKRNKIVSFVLFYFRVFIPI